MQDKIAANTYDTLGTADAFAKFCDEFYTSTSWTRTRTRTGVAHHNARSPQYWLGTMTDTWKRPLFMLSLRVIHGGLSQDGITFVPSRFGFPFDMCVALRCTFDGVVELEEGLVVPSRRVDSTARLPSTGGHSDRGCSGNPIPEHEVVKAIPEERESERIVEQISWLVLVERIKERIEVQSVDVLVPQMRREIVEVIQLVLVERVKDPVADQMDILVPGDSPRCSQDLAAGHMWEARYMPSRSRTPSPSHVPRHFHVSAAIWETRHLASKAGIAANKSSHMPSILQFEVRSDHNTSHIRGIDGSLVDSQPLDRDWWPAISKHRCTGQSSNTPVLLMSVISSLRSSHALVELLTRLLIRALPGHSRA